jgi:hypothetical protein
MMLCAKSWIRNFRGEMAVHAGRQQDGLIRVRAGRDYYPMTEAEWGALPLWYGPIPFM